MDDVSRAICFAGFALFVFGLAIGFFLKAPPNPRAALSAHLNAVQSGTFLVALALLWPKLAIWPHLAAPLGHAIWIAFWALEVGMVIAAFAPPASEGAPAGPVRRSAVAFQGAGSVAMFLALAALLFTFGPAAHFG
jgi:(hydroxyamino)benzene mutase